MSVSACSSTCNCFASHGLEILGLTLALLAIKGVVVVAVLVKLRGSDSETAWRSGVALAQGGEFCFALMAQMQQTRLLPEDLGHLLLGRHLLFDAGHPADAARALPALAARLHRKPNQEVQLEEIQAQSASLSGHVLICGYGRVGLVHRALPARREQLAFIALDDDPVRVQEAAAGEQRVHYGDSRRGELLAAIGLERARLLVIAGGQDRCRHERAQGRPSLQHPGADPGAHPRRQPARRTARRRCHGGWYRSCWSPA